MTQGELEKLGIPPSIPFSDLERRIMEDIVRRIKVNGFSTASADWQISRLQQLGESEENIEKWVQEALKASNEEIERIFSDEVYKQYMGHERAYNMSSVKQTPFEDNREIQQLTEAVKKQTAGTFESITGSLGFVKQDASTGRVSPVEISAFYRSTLDAAMYDIQSGTFDYQTVLKRTINDMTKSGLRWIDYESGRHNRIDVAARRAVMTGFRQVQGKINEQVAAQLGTDTYEVTYHVGARPTHQVWQGRIWTMKQLISICGLGSVTGLHGANCYHDYNAFIPGISVRAYTDEQLEQMINEENTPQYYNGREYTAYEALQQQRKMETAMRATRQQISLMGKGGADEEQIILKKARYQGQMREYKDFSKKMDLPEQMDRVYQDGLKRKFVFNSEEQKEHEKVQQKKKVAKPADSVILKTLKAKEEIQVHSIGKIDRKIYKCITEDIVTDEVIITDERIDHVKARHPKDFEEVLQCVPEVIKDPDYIFKDERENTGLVVKAIKEGKDNVQVVLRVQTTKDEEGYKNSIISCWKISDKRLQNYLRNKAILYKK